MKSGQGSLSTKRIRPGSIIWISRTRSLRSLNPAPLYRSNENFTSSAVTGSPLWNFTPRRMTNSYVSPSFDWLHDSARLGVLGPAGIGFTSASWSAYSTMNGVMIPSVSAGSSQRDASVMWMPHVIVPSGAAAAGKVLPGLTRKARVKMQKRRAAALIGRLLSDCQQHLVPEPRFCQGGATSVPTLHRTKVLLSARPRAPTVRPQGGRDGNFCVSGHRRPNRRRRVCEPWLGQRPPGFWTGWPERHARPERHPLKGEGR